MNRGQLTVLWLGTMAILGAPTIAIAQSTSRAYVANRGSASISVVDVTTGATIGTIALDAAPHDVEVTYDSVFVSLPTLNRVDVFDPVSLRRTSSAAVPGAPRALENLRQPLADAPQLLISTDDGLRPYTWSSGVVGAPIAVGPGSLRAVDVAPSPGSVYVAACDGGPTVRSVDWFARTVSAPVSTGAAPCAVHAGATAVYVANTDDDTVTVFTPALQAPLTVPVADRPVAFAEASEGVWVLSASGVLTLLDRLTHGVLSVKPVAGTPSALGLAYSASFAPIGIIVSDLTGNVRVMSPAGDPVRTIPVGAQPGAIAMGDSNPAEIVTLSSNGVWPNDSTYAAAMSLDGRFVAFTSRASTLVDGDTNEAPDVFVRDRLLRRTTRVSVASDGSQATGSRGATSSHDPLLDGTGRRVLFASSAVDLVPHDTNGREDLFVHDRDVDADGIFDEPGQIDTRRVSVKSDGSEGTCRVAPRPSPGPGPPVICEWPFLAAGISADGRQVLFASPLEFDDADVNGFADVYAHDLRTGRTTLLTRGPAGRPSEGHATEIAFSADARIVAYQTTDPALVPYDTNGVDDTFAIDRDPDANGVFDEALPALQHVSLQPGGALHQFASFPIAVSPDGRWVAYGSNPSRVGIFDRVTGHNSLVRDIPFLVTPRGQFSGDARHLALRVFGLSTLFVRADRDTDADGIFDEADAIDFATTVPYTGFVQRIAVDGSLRSSFTQPDTPFNGLAVRDLLGPAPPLFDGDADGLGTAFEERFGLNASIAGGDDGADGDPDGDGRTSLEEQQAGTHPRGQHVRYLAEGATGSFFSTRVAVANPGTSAARVLLRYQTESGHTTSTPMVVPARARRFVNVRGVPSLSSASFSTVIESDVPVVVDRSMFWSTGFFGSHAETSLAGPSTSWFLAEGATHGGFDLFYLLQNPSATQSADVEIRFLRATGPPLVRTYTVAASRRLTVYVDQIPGLEAADVSAAITSLNAVPVIVERAMYYTRNEAVFTAGHGSAGVTSTATEWFLAEGATGTFFNLFLLLANPTATAADVRITYLRPSAAPIVRTRTIPASSRVTINVANEDPALADAAVSARVVSENGVGIVVERSMWWPAGNWHEAHNSPGATATAARWGFADGETGGPPFNTQTYFLIANPGSEDATVRVTLLFEDGRAAAERTFVVRGSTRFNVPVGVEFPGVTGGYGAIVESIGATPVPIVVERAMYSDAEGIVWAAGTNALGTPIP